MIAVVALMLCLPLAGGNEAATGAEKCSSRVVALDFDGTGSAPVEDEALREELGEFVPHCNYTLATEALEEAVGDCAVIAVTIEGSAPEPRLLTVNKGWDEVVGQEEVSPTDGEMAWAWTGDALNCDQAGCLDGETVQVLLLGKEFGLTDGEENCPWTIVQARFELESAP